MAEGFKINSYEPFVVGMKFKPDIDINSIIENVKNVLKDKEFEIPPPSQGNIKFGPPVETIGLKNNVEFKINLQTQAINIEGDNIEDVISIVEQTPGYLEDAGFDMLNTIEFNEIIANVIVDNNENPRDVINKSCTIDLNNLSDLDTSVTGIKIDSIGESSKELVNFIIQPRVGNPNKLYHIHSVYRFGNLEKIIDMSKELPNKIETLLDSLKRD